MMPLLRQPPLHDLGDELRAIIAPQILRHPMLGDRLLQPVQHIRRLQGPIHLQHMTLPCVFIQDRQHPKRPGAHRRIPFGTRTRKSVTQLWLLPGIYR